jgi:hypothetical protein
METLKGRLLSDSFDPKELSQLKAELDSRLTTWVDHVDSRSNWKYEASLRLNDKSFTMEITLRSECALWESEGVGATAHESLDRAMEHFVQAQTGEIEMDTTDRSHQSRAA